MSVGSIFKTVGKGIGKGAKFAGKRIQRAARVQAGLDPDAPKRSGSSDQYSETRPRRAAKRR